MRFLSLARLHRKRFFWQVTCCMSVAKCNTIQLKITQLQPATCRIETTHTVTASNLFKYCEPCHGLILFKHHHPLHFDQQQVAELLCTAHQWFAASQQAHPEANYPFFLWNCLPRAGASQFHGHAQVMLSKVCACNDTLLACSTLHKGHACAASLCQFTVPSPDSHKTKGRHRFMTCHITTPPNGFQTDAMYLVTAFLLADHTADQRLDNT